MSNEVFFYSNVEYFRLPIEYILSDIVVGGFLTLGILNLIKIMKLILPNDDEKKYVTLPGLGMILFLASIIGEIMCETSIHGGFPETVLGTFHVIFILSYGGLVFFSGSVLFYNRVKEIIQDDKGLII